MLTLSLHFQGPMTFFKGPASLFHSPLAGEPCVYLWTIQSQLDGLHYIHYVGEATHFAQRQRQHLVAVLGLEYGIFDPEDAERGVARRLWPGLWREKNPEAPGHALQFYEEGTAKVIAYVQSLRVFAAQAPERPSIRRHVEGVIAQNLRAKHPEGKVLYPDDNKVGLGRDAGPLRLSITADASIAGLDDTIEW